QEQSQETTTDVHEILPSRIPALGPGPYCSDAASVRKGRPVRFGQRVASRPENGGRCDVLPFAVAGLSGKDTTTQPPWAGMNSRRRPLVRRGIRRNRSRAWSAVIGTNTESKVATLSF